MKQWLSNVAFRKIKTKHLRAAWYVVLVITVLDILMPDALPLIDEIGLGWLSIVMWQELQSRKGAVADVEGEEVKS